MGKAPTYHCDICGLKLSSTGVLARHKRILHPEGGFKKYTCDICSKVSLGINAHKSHVNWHSRKYKCQICDKIFKNSLNLRVNLFVIHSKI